VIPGFAAGAMGWYDDLEGDPRSKREPAARRRANVQPI